MSSISLALLLFVAPAAAAKKNPGAPLPAGPDIAWAHAPFEAGACGVCHKSDDPKNPGPLTAKKVNDLCLGCHEDMKEVLAKKSVHMPVEDACTGCHNAHNSKYKKLLLEPNPALCVGCHEEIGGLMKNAKVKHDALTKDAACLNCHDPHGSNIEHLLRQLPYDLCVGCHGQDGVTSDKGEKLTNIKKLLEDNPVRHGPIAQKDCSGCHVPHGSPYFRLLVEEYPATFYAPYDPKNYALCYKCHNNKVVSEEKTTKLTNFRNGEQNLHFKHVHKETRGRTCRACHEVHASKKPHQIRDAVPYGSGGWLLPVKFSPAKDGGSCEKTCHAAKPYKNK